MEIREHNFALDTVVYHILGSILLGLGIGLYKRIAHAVRAPTPRYPTVHVFFLSLLALTVTPFLKFPSVSNQIKAEHANDFINGKVDPELEALYYQNRVPAITYFFVNGFLVTLMIYSLVNALQHQNLKE
jgi:hypothetical protein